MANNRMYLRCTACDEAFGLAKSYGMGWTAYSEDGALQAFFDKHAACYGTEPGSACDAVFDLRYESGGAELQDGTTHVTHSDLLMPKLT